MVKTNPGNGNQPTILHHQAMATYSGPLPPAADFERYNAALPGAAERILAMAEKEAAHRHDAEDSLVKEEVRASKTGQFGSKNIG